MKKKSRGEREGWMRKEDEKRIEGEGKEMKKIDFTASELNCVENVKG